MLWQCTKEVLVRGASEKCGRESKDCHYPFPPSSVVVCHKSPVVPCCRLVRQCIEGVPLPNVPPKKWGGILNESYCPSSPIGW